MDEWKLCPDVRGNLTMLVYIVFALVFLILDIVFPNLFFDLKYRFAVEGGGPSDMYRSGQKFGRVLLVISIIVCIIMSFTTH